MEHSLHLLLCCSFMQGSDRIGKITSDENLADSVHSQHFAGKKECLSERHLSKGTSHIFDMLVYER